MSMQPSKEAKRTIYDETAEQGILKILDLELVAFRNEFHYRLENTTVYQLDVEKIEHHVVDAAIKRLTISNKIEPTGLPGRRPNSYIVARYPHLFYKKCGTEYGRLPEIMKEKMDLSLFILGLSSYAGFYAQSLWGEAFRTEAFNILKENAVEFNGRKASVEGDIDFIVEKEGLVFGVEVKNGFSYPGDIRNKFRIAAELGTIPWFIARNLPFKVRKWIRSNGGFLLIYESSIYPPECKPKIDKCIDRLGYPIIILEGIDETFKKRLSGIARLAYATKDESERRLGRYKKFFKSTI